MAVWLIDVRRWAEREYRHAVTEFVSAHVVGASMRSAPDGGDGDGRLVLVAETYQHRDGSFRRGPSGALVAESVVVPLPEGVALPR